MSEKKAKAKRKAEEKILVNIQIKVNNKGQMMIDGFPSNPYQGMHMMATATQMVAKKYQELAAENTLPDGNGKKIIPVGKSPLVGLDGKRL